MSAHRPHLNLTQLQTLLELSRLGTLAAAAAALDYTPGAVSQHLAALERAVGTRLVLRAGRGLVLTEAGRLLAEHAEALLAAEREAIRVLDARSGRVAGPLTVGTWGSTAATLLSPVIAQLGERHPQVVVRSKEVDLDDAASAVSRASVDVAFGLEYVDAPLPRHRGIEVLGLQEEDFVVVVAESPAASSGPFAEVADLAELAWILPPPGTQYGAAIRAGFRRRGFEPEVVHEVTDTAASLTLASAGLGATVATPLMLRLNPGVPLTRLSMRDPVTRGIVLLTSADHVSGAVRAFADVVRSVMGSLLDEP